ncbi:MAG: hypothetical protein KJ949_01460 [Nanoarchaeota archaeon]|nr:hypothetical protein [Nanoarchaeota archaeon]MBU4308436.1 hypothetical protein [Nanoarchaeota archaeon]
MKTSIKRGLGFGITSGVITTLGLIIGLYSSTNSKITIIGGIIIIAVADSLSDAFGIHISEEYASKNKEKDIWRATFSTLFFKFIFAITFIIPFLFFKLSLAIIINIIWGLVLISIFSYYTAKKHKTSVKKAVLEHLVISIVVIVLTYFIGMFIGKVFA